MEAHLRKVECTAFRVPTMPGQGDDPCGTGVARAAEDLDRLRLLGLDARADRSLPLPAQAGPEAERSAFQGGVNDAALDLQGGGRASRRSEDRRRRSNARAIRRSRLRTPDGEAGMATAEYAIATLAAVAFAALLVAVLSSGEIKGLLMSLITSALNFG